MPFTGTTNKSSPANSDIVELLKKSNLMSLAPKFQKHAVPVDVIWFLNDAVLSELNLSELEKLKYNTARKQFGEQGNYFRIK